MREAELTIGIPTAGAIKAITVADLITMLRPFPGVFRLAIMTGVYVHQNENKIVEEAKSVHSKYLLFVEDDMDFPQDGLAKLLKDDKDIVGANYNEKHFPLTSTIKIAGDNGQYADGQVEIPNVPFKVESVPMGFTLIKMSVFEKLKKPYFFHNFAEDGEEYSQDVYFCRKVREAGIEIWCDPTIKCWHSGTYMY